MTCSRSHSRRIAELRIEPVSWLLGWHCDAQSTISHCLCSAWRSNFMKIIPSKKVFFWLFWRGKSLVLLETFLGSILSGHMPITVKSRCWYLPLNASLRFRIIVSRISLISRAEAIYLFRSSKASLFAAQKYKIVEMVCFSLVTTVVTNNRRRGSFPGIAYISWCKQRVVLDYFLFTWNKLKCLKCVKMSASSQF